MKYILHRLGIVFSPSLTNKGVGPFPIKSARKRFEQRIRLIEEFICKHRETKLNK
ncbi:hypothetical protein [Bacillus cereus group sp. TH253LC]|uniref:hypothetical protein n=1 Tax=Bacillus cereus group sp. TH253LC TaxID=3018043 RepID=UPI0022E28BC4|nr:hypothetical protein [Bacillus cereus group sp. TH253LC]MDA1545835.1 hypothetical protein [Bacillus cereus group sp. TH253LC]